MHSKPFRVAAVQLNSGLEPSANRRAAEPLVREAAGLGAQLVVLPELFTSLGNLADVIPHAEPIPGPTSRWLADLARQLRVYLVGGSLCEQSSDAQKGYNASLLFGPDGSLLATYRKIHLFDVDIPGHVAYHESSYMLPGNTVCCTELPDVVLGQATCYDLRFAELFRCLSEAGANLLAIPAAFTHTTGEAHWQILLRARAIENQCFVVAANQCGQHGPTFATYGHSQIIDPWGRVLAEADEQPQVIVADLDLAEQARIRAQLPCLKHRKSLDSLAVPRRIPLAPQQ